MESEFGVSYSCKKCKYFCCFELGSFATFWPGNHSQNPKMSQHFYFPLASFLRHLCQFKWYLMMTALAQNAFFACHCLLSPAPILILHLVHNRRVPFICLHCLLAQRFFLKLGWRPLLFRDRLISVYLLAMISRSMIEGSWPVNPPQIVERSELSFYC